jgi:hypothetical protein
MLPMRFDALRLVVVVGGAASLPPEREVRRTGGRILLGLPGVRGRVRGEGAGGGVGGGQAALGPPDLRKRAIGREQAR